MIKIEIGNKYDDFINEYAQKLTLNGYSNLNSNDLNKASRTSFQKTGLFCELAYYLWIGKTKDDLKASIDKKLGHYEITGEGDGGRDDTLTHNGKTRLVDVKGSHCNEESRIQYLNLIVPRREYHKDSIYIAAFTIGKDRDNIDHTILQGFCFNEDIHSIWNGNKDKFCVPTKELRPIQELEQYIFPNKKAN